MSSREHSRRCLLFCPGGERRKIDKASSLDVDGVILDLEDGSALNRKDEARQTSATALDEVDFGSSERIVRINPVGSGLEEQDLSVIGQSDNPPDTIMVPKVESAAALNRVAAILTEIEERHQREIGSTGILALIETARGVLALSEISSGEPRLKALVFGAEDLCADLGAIRTQEGHEVEYAKSLIVLHSAAANLQAIDTPYVDLNAVEDLVIDTRRSLESGYTGRLAIHPKQIDPITTVFTPGPEEIEKATRLLAEHSRQQAEGRGVFELDGKMVDMPMVRAAERVMERARGSDKDQET